MTSARAVLIAADGGDVFVTLNACALMSGGVILTSHDILRLTEAALSRWPSLDVGTASRCVRAYLAPLLVGGTERILYDRQREPLIAILDWLACNP